MIKVNVYQREMGNFLGHVSEYFGEPKHAFLEFYGKSAGFAASNASKYRDGSSRGVVRSPDLWGGSAIHGWADGSARHLQFFIEDCCIDEEKLKKNLDKHVEIYVNNNSLIYHYWLNNCYSFVEDVVNDAVEESYRDDATWLCYIPFVTNYEWYAYGVL